MGNPTRPNNSGSAQSFNNGSRNAGAIAAHQQGPKGASQSLNWVHVMIPTAINAPQPCVPFAVPPGGSVRVRGSNGTNGNNVGAVFVALSRAALLNGLATCIHNFDDVAFPVNNAGQIWVMSANLGDGVTVSVLNPQSGQS